MFDAWLLQRNLRSSGTPLRDTVELALQLCLHGPERAGVLEQIASGRILFPSPDVLAAVGIRVNALNMLWQRECVRNHAANRYLMADSSPQGHWNF